MIEGDKDYPWCYLCGLHHAPIHRYKFSIWRYLRRCPADYCKMRFCYSHALGIQIQGNDWHRGYGRIK